MALFITVASSSTASLTPIDSIHTPVKIATGPSDAYIGLSLMPDGEIRHYNYGEQAESGNFYISTRDGGKSWQTVKTPREMINGDICSPISGEYIRLVNINGATYCIRTSGGINGNRSISKISNLPSIMLKPPVFADGGNRIIVAAHGGTIPKGCYTYVSTDDGLTWQRSNTITAPDHTGGGHHQGIRWNHGAVEPSVIELNNGSLWMLMRTSQDQHYESFSTDGGMTWSESQPSRFYGTITMPTMGRIADGRILLFWCNTTPMPELPTADGVWDDVFTNRDVTHVAISEDDGQTWIGFRELYIDPLRNEKDYATRGAGIDRGMHQAQFVEPAPGKIVAAIGQHPLHRAIVRFDVDWLYETERTDCFEHGLESWSTFNYIKGIKGHCSYNRINGAELIDHPDLDTKKALLLRYEQADTLVSDSRGAVWNFPTMKSGTFTASIRFLNETENIWLTLNDRWFNPSDTVSVHESLYKLPLNRKLLKIDDNKWHNISIEWNLASNNKSAIVKIDGKRTNMKLSLQHECPNGISYVHFIACPVSGYKHPDNAGIIIERVSAKAKNK
ncbi:MAG: glycoside hydrolase [Paramuribaculum sp.]|nr:glycoside hydrolase [Paramuribaculum sp.]